MPLDKPKALDKYPASFWDALRAGGGRHRVVEVQDFRGAEREARRFRAFLRGVKAAPSIHPLAQILAQYHVRSLIEWNDRNATWEVTAVVSPRYLEPVPISGDDALFAIMSRTVEGNAGGG